MTQPFISVIIVNYNSGERLEKCIAHLAKQSWAEFETIVVDNASSDGSEKATLTAPIHVQLITSDTNLGFAAANNLAAQNAIGEWLAFLNPDAYADHEWLAEFARATKRHPGVDAFGSTQIDAQNADRIDGAGDVCHGFGLYYRGAFGWRAKDLPEEGECFAPCAAAAFYKRKSFEELGGFDERFFCYGEDVDLGFRLRRRGGRAVQLNKAIVLHEGSGITGRRSAFSVYHGVRNRIWFYGKNLPSLLFYGLSPVHALVNFAMFGRAIIQGQGAPFWQGMRDGIAGLELYRRQLRAEEGSARLSASDIIKLMTWSPIKLLRRGPDVRPLQKQR